MTSYNSGKDTNKSQINQIPEGKNKKGDSHKPSPKRHLGVVHTCT